jgi:esterase/lipase
MKTELLEFNNPNGNTIRGIFVLNNEDNKKVLLMVGGFEGSATTQKKFKILTDKIDFSSLRIDYSGVGISDGDFSKLTVNNLSLDIKTAAEELNKRGFDKIYIACHSLSACAVSLLIDYFDKIILIAPALNQKELLRYWFVNSLNEKQGFTKEINWNNYKQHLNEEEFLKDCQRNDKMTSMNNILSDYFMENMNKDYSSLLINSQKKIFHIHGLNDDVVPPESITTNFDNKILIEEGGHDLERPDIIKKWIEPTIQFLIK